MSHDFPDWYPKDKPQAGSLHRVVRRLIRKLRWVGWPIAWLGEVACCLTLLLLDWLMENVFGAYMDWCEEDEPPNTRL